MALLETESLSKHYGPARALDSLTLSIKPGEIVGLLGPNGAGKSTALRLILGFLKPTSGSAQVDGFDCWSDSLEVRKRVAYLPGELRLYDNYTGRQLLHFLGGLRNQTPGPEAERLAKHFDIDLDRPLTKLSSGMKRKVALLAVLVPQVPLVILDEPTNTLDPTMRDQLLDQIRAAKSQGKAVLFSSHVLQEVEAVCDRVVILRLGKLVHEHCMADLRDGRHVTATLTGSLTEPAPPGSTMNANGLLDLEYRGELPMLLEWLARQPLANLKIEPLGLGPIYRKYHGGYE
ncbi:ATP-binding cassette domain-containing protein [soil metagenome]